MPEFSRLTQAIGYTFHHSRLLSLALTHPSFGARNNQRLEFLGDSVLELCMSHHLFLAYPEMKEGRLTALRASLVCEDTLYRIAERLQLDDYIRMLPPLRPDTRGRKALMADAVEAVLAAVYLDGGLEAARETVERLWAVEFAADREAGNGKSKLQEFAQARHWPEPKYDTVGEEGPAHQRRFTVAVYLEDRELARAEGGSKKDAQQKAAEIALKTLMGQEDA